MQIFDSWLRDMPQQFQNKKNIEILVNAFARQIQEVGQVFEDLNTMSDLENAVGVNLDMVGNILSMSRKEANTIVRKAENTRLTDDMYRKVLQYKAILNSCECTYQDIMSSIALLWDTDNITYHEPADRPATVLLTLPTVGLDSMDPAFGKVLAIKPAGVAVIYTISYTEKILFSAYERYLFYLTLKWKITFYSFAFGKYKILDGTWLLDGSVLLNAMEIDVPLGIIYKGIKTKYSESISSNLMLTYEVSNPGKAETNHMMFRTKVNQTEKDMVYLDGTRQLDGEYSLDSVRWVIPAVLMVAISISSNCEKIS